MALDGQRGARSKAIDSWSDLDGQEHAFAIGYPKKLNEVYISEDDTGVYRISNFELGHSG